MRSLRDALAGIDVWHQAIYDIQCNLMHQVVHQYDEMEYTLNFDLSSDVIEID